MADGFRTMDEKTWSDRVLLAFVRTRLGRRLFTGPLAALDKRFMKVSGGRSLAIGHPVCLLHTIGARSGEPRTNPVLFTPRGDDVIVVASKGGAEKHPAWYFNVRRTPIIDVEIRGVRRRMEATELSGSDREETWAYITKHFAGYDQYQALVTREIPVIAFRPVSGSVEPTRPPA